MKEALERDLLRRLRGELPAAEAAALERRLESDPEARRLAARLAATWDGLSPSPAPEVPPGFSGRVLARARAERDADLSLTLAPRWAKLAAAAALAAGVGIGAASVALSGEAGAERASSEVAWNGFDDQGLGESYLMALESEDAGRVERP